MPDLQIHLFGVGRVRHGEDGHVDALAPSVRTLLGYLALNRHRPHHRDRLASEFWSDVDDRCARNRLSTALWRLRKILEPDGVAPGAYLVATRSGEVAFNQRSDHWLDVAEFEQAAARVTDVDAAPDRNDLAAFERAASVFGNDLLEGVDQPWLVLERERLTQLYLHATARCLDRYANLGDLDRAIAAGRRILDRDPLREDIHRSLIRLYVRTGQRSRATDQFDHCRDLLHEELGVAPLPETRAAAASIEPVSNEPASVEVVRIPASTGGPHAPTGSTEHPSLDVVPPTTQPSVEEALAAVEAASRSLGMAASRLDTIARQLRGALPPG